jgi:translocation and assembly module TamB
MRKILKILLYIIGGIIALLLLVVVLLQTPWGKNILRTQVVSFLQKKLQTDVQLSKIDYNIPNSIAIKGFLIKDLNKDTLLFVNNLSVSLDMLDLISSKITVDHAMLDGAYANIVRNIPDTTFNYTFITEAFSSTDTAVVVQSKKDTTSSKPLVLDIAKVTLQNIRLNYKDATGGTHFSMQLGKLTLKPKAINISNMHFELSELSVEHLKSFVATDTSYLPPQPKDTSTSSGFALKADKIALNDIKFNFLSKQDSMAFNLVLGKLETQINSFDLLQQNIDIGQLQLEQVVSSFVQGKMQKKATPAPKSDKETDTNSNRWKVYADNLLVKNLNFLYDDNNQKRQAQGMDYAHLNFSSMYTTIGDVYYSPDTISANLKHLSLLEQCGLHIIALRSRVLYNNKGAALNQLYLLTPTTILQDNIVVKYPSIAALQKRMDQLYLDINLNKSKVSVKDILLFVQAEQRKMLHQYRNDILHVDATLSGYLNHLIIKKLALSGLPGTQVDLKGVVKGLPEADKLIYDLEIEELKTTSATLDPFLPASVKQQVQLPEWFSVTGHINGTTKDYYPDLNIASSEGDIDLKGKVLLSPGTNNEVYDLTIYTTGFNLGKVLRKQDLLRRVSIQGKVQGESFDIKRMNSSFDIAIPQAWVMGYDYKNITLKGLLNNQSFTVNGSGNDPNLDFSLSAQGDLSQTYPSLIADADIRNIDVQALGFYQDTLQAKAKIQANFSSLNPDFPDGTLTINQPKLIMAGYNLSLEDILLQSKPTADSIQNLYLNASNILRLNIDGKLPLTRMGDAILSHVNDHYKIKDTVIPFTDDYYLNLYGNVSYHPIIKTWLPDLKPFDTIRITGNVNTNALSLDAFIPRLRYADTRIDSGTINVFEQDDTLSYFVGLKQFTKGQFDIWFPSVNGTIQNNSVYAHLNIKDSTQKEQFYIGAIVNQTSNTDTSLGSTTQVKIMDKVLFNYDNWYMNPSNLFSMNNKGMHFKQIQFVHDNESILANSNSEAFGSPFTIGINNFRLSNITQMISKDTLVVDGVLQLSAEVDLQDSFPKFNANATIAQLTAYNMPVGNLALKANSENATTYNAWLNLTEQNNDIEIAGKYFTLPKDSNDFNFDLNIKALALKSFEGLTFGSLKNSSGFIKGKLNLTGTTTRPKILGNLYTDNLTTTVSMLGSPYKLPKEEIVFSKEGMLFKDFSIYDVFNNKAVINGKVRTRDFTKYFLNLDLTARNWQAVNSKKEDFPMFYGKLLTSANINIKGLVTAPKIGGDLTIHDSTNITYAMLDTGPGIQETEGVVRFIDSRDTTFIDSTLIVSTKNMRLSRSSEMNVNVAIEKNALFNVVIDPVSGDNLQVRGDANLNTFIGQDGSIGLTGMYELQDGYYELNYNFLKRKFKIKPGSIITLSGEPLDAEVDITAAYSANMAPYELVEKQEDAANLPYYRQRLPFEVLIKLKGKVMKPEITFDIVLPDDKDNVVSTTVAETVQRKLAELRNDPSVLNKQVFAALILGRFIADDPFSSGSGGGLEYAARQSASRFLSDQLNMIAGQLIQGFELNVGLESSEDYTTGQKSNRTDLNVTASKRLFNDRLKVTVGNDFQLEGQQAQSQQSNLIPGNLSADYSLTADGRYLIRAYRVNQIQNVIDGYVVETGVSFKLTVDYNRFKNIFRKPKRNQVTQNSNK